MRNVISSFILEENFDSFVNFLSNFYSEELSYDQLKCKTDLIKVLKTLHDELHKERIKIKKEIDESNRSVETLQKEYIYDFYFNRLPQYSYELSQLLKKHNNNLYTKLFQAIGTNIRKSGNAFDNIFYTDKILLFPQRTNSLVKILRRRNLKENNGVQIVIDAFRNPYEINFFKDRYSNFYLFSINTNEEDRINRLSEKNLSLKQIKLLDDTEYPRVKRDTETDIFSAQDIQRCIELSDVYLSNTKTLSHESNTLKQQLIKYVSLIMHPGIVQPTHLERCMQIAFNAKLNSGCISRQVGAVVTDEDYYVHGIGWNDCPKHQVSCNLRFIPNLINKTDDTAYSEFEKTDIEYRKYIESIINDKHYNDNLNGLTMRWCFKDSYNSFKKEKNQIHTRALHAEENAFLQISKKGGMGIEDGYLFTTASPCELCSKKAYQLGIKKIYYIDPYPGISRRHILESGKVELKMVLFEGAIGRAYTQFYSNIMNAKDEIELLSGFKFPKIPKQTTTT